MTVFTLLMSALATAIEGPLPWHFFVLWAALVVVFDFIWPNEPAERAELSRLKAKYEGAGG